MLDHALERFPGQVEPVELGIAALERGHDPKGLGVVVETLEIREAAIERPFAGMTERRVAEVVGERKRLRQILIEAERTRQRARDLGDLERMGQPGPEMIALVKHEDLGLVGQPAKRGRMDDPVAIAPKGVARGA